MAYAEGGLAYDEMKELGIDDKYAIPISQGVGIINAGIEFSQISMILRTIPGLRKIVSRGLGFGVKEIVKEKLPKALGKVGIDYAKFLAGELGQEEAQEIVTILGTEFAKDLSNKIEDTDLTKATSEEIVNRLTETFKGSLGLMVMGIPGTSAQVVTEITSNIANKNAQKTQTEIAEILGEEPTEIIPPTTEIPPEVTPPVEIVPEVTPEIVPEAKKEVVEPPIIEEPTKVIPEVKEPVKKPEIEKRTSEDLQIEMAIEEAKEERYRHKPLTEKEGWARLDNLIPAFGKDIYTENAVQYFGTGEKVFDNKTVSILQAVRDMPEKEIKIYRAIEKGEPKSIKSGDWVTVNKEYATEHGETILDGKYEIAEKLVKVKDLTTSADSINEQGYYPIKPTPVEKAVEKKPPKKKRIVKKPTGRIQIKIPKEFDRARIPYLDYALGFQTSDEDFKDYYVGIQPLYKKDAPAFDTVTEELKDLAPDLYYATKEGDTELFKEKVFQDLMKLEKPEVEEGVLSISEEIAELKKKAIRTVGLDLEKGEKISWIDEDTGEIHKGTVIETVEEKGIAKIENDDTHKVDDFDVIYLVEREKPPKVEKKPEVVKEEKPKVKEKIKVYPVSEVKEFITKHKKELVRGQNLLLKNEKLETMLNDAYKKEGVTPSKAEYGNHLGKIFWNRKLGKSDLTTKDKNAKYKEVFEEPKYRIGIEKFKSADIKEIENILYKATGTRNITTVPEIIEKKNALGKYYNGMIEVAKTGDMKVTAYHETYHFVEDLLMTDKEVAQAERFEKSAEKRAEGFVEYVKDITTYRGKLKNFFVKLWRKLKNFMRSKHNIENIYDKILKGYYKERAILPSGEILKRVKEKIAEPKYKEPAITDKQRKTIYAIADEIDLDYDEVHIVLKQLTDKESLNDLAQDEYKNFIASLKSFKKQIDEGFRYYDEETEQVKEETKERIDKIQQYSEKSGEDKAKAKIETSEELKDNINESIARKEKKLTTAKYKDQKIRISGFVKHGGDFVDMAGYVAEVTGNKEVFPLSKNINEKVHRFIHKYADTVLSIHKKHNKSIKGITEETYKLLTKYFVTGKMDKSLTANKGLMTLVNDLDNIREYTKPIVRKHRVSQYFANRLRLTDFHPSQRKQLKQWETDYG
ncbi:hypothetical protein KAS42_06635, partial [bacterium]|nr:hypothetical protein [bacterium]